MASEHPPTQHSHKHHREMHVAHRRVKHLMKSGGYAGGGGMSDKAVEGFAKRLAKHERAEIAEEKHEGEKRGGRLDKHARGGAVKGYQLGGPIHKLTPKKHKPHVAVNVVNISRGGLGGRGGAGVRPAIGAGLPAAGGAPIGAPPGGPPAGLPMRPPGMKRGGPIKKQIGGGLIPARPAAVPVRAPMMAARPAVPARPVGVGVGAAPRLYKKGGHAKKATGGGVHSAWSDRQGGTEKTTKPGEMRKGKKFGEGTGMGGREEARHMKGRYP